MRGPRHRWTHTELGQHLGQPAGPATRQPTHGVIELGMSAAAEQQRGQATPTAAECPSTTSFEPLGQQHVVLASQDAIEPDRASRRAHRADGRAARRGNAPASPASGQAPARRAMTTAAARSSSATAGSVAAAHDCQPGAAVGGSRRSVPTTAVDTNAVHSSAADVAR